MVDHLGPRQAPAVRRALAAGRDVACLNADAAVADALGRRRVHVLPQGALPAFEEAAQVDGAFDLTELAVGELLRRRPGVAGRLARLGGRDEVYRYLCRLMLREVGGLFAVAQLVASPELAAYERVEIDRHWPNGSDLAFLAELALREGLELTPGLAVALERTSFGVTARPAGLRAKTAARAAREAAGLWAEWLRRVRPADNRLPVRPLLIRTYATDWALDVGGQRRLRNVDFVVDDDLIRPEDVGFWVEQGVPIERDAELAARGYAVLRRGAVGVGPVAFTVRVLPTLLRAAALFARLAAAEGWWQQPVRVLLSEILLWREIGRRVRPRILLVYNDLHPTGAARTLALRRAGGTTVVYEFASSWAFDDRGWVPDFVYGFTVADAIVTWGPLHTETFRLHRGAIGDYWEVGCLWSEHARVVRDDPEIGDYYREELGRAQGLSLAGYERVVGVFDTSTAPLLLGRDDLVAFYAGVAALADRLPRTLFLCKPKRPFEEALAGVAGWPEVEAALAAAPNVAVLDPFFETAAVVGLCDLSLNACYTSTAIETIGAGKPAVYYDPTDRFPSAFFRKIPRLVAKCEEELAGLVLDLCAVDDETQAIDLRERFSGLEGHFDGLAITRLRRRLRAALDA